jgi:molybdopterin molybdotransferase
MQEDTRVDAARPDTVRVIAPAAAGDHVRRQGGDVAAGAIVSEAGQRMTAARLALLAAAGVPAMRVGRQPSVGLLATGSELREAGQPLAPGLIYESHRVALAEGVTQAGGRPRVYPIVPDSLAATRAALATALAECEIVVTCGGVSVGEMDFVKSAFEQLGGELQFWQVAIKPGRPFAFGRRGRAFLFGLPGNPVSALVTFALLVRPALLRWQGARDIFLPTQPGVLGAALANGDPRRHFMRVRVDPHGQVFSAGAQASHVLSALAQADGLVDMPAATSLPRGSSVRVLRWGG